MNSKAVKNHNDRSLQLRIETISSNHVLATTNGTPFPLRRAEDSENGCRDILQVPLSSDYVLSIDQVLVMYNVYIQESSCFHH